MTVAQLSKLITDRLMARAELEPSPLRYLVTALLRLKKLKTTDELVEFGREYKILYAAPDWKDGGLCLR